MYAFVIISDRSRAENSDGSNRPATGVRVLTFSEYPTLAILQDRLNEIADTGVIPRDLLKDGVGLPSEEQVLMAFKENGDGLMAPVLPGLCVFISRSEEADPRINFDDYQSATTRTAVFPESMGLTYTALGINGEAGEVAELVKKLYRDFAGVTDKKFRHAATLEVGDVLWYLAQFCRMAEISLEDCARRNLEKLASRQERGTLHGSGDER